MDNSALLRMSPRELALHLRHAPKKQSPRAVSVHLLETIELEVLPATVFHLFLNAVRSPCPLKEALWHEHTKQVRYAAIR